MTSDDTPMNQSQFDRFDELCDEFEKQCAAGNSPKIESFLARISEARRTSLLEELIRLEVHYLSNSSVQLSDYLRRFPDYEAKLQSLAEIFSISPPQETLNYSAEKEVASGDQETIGFTGTPGSSSNVIRYFGDYELLEEIARGGMGVVYKARQVNLNRIVALKMILSGQIAGEEEVKRFYAEAEAAGSLDHPAIVPIYEVGNTEGQHYFSMGFVDGQSLQDLLRDGPLSPRRAATLTKQIAEAIAFANESGVIHRDLKPANVLLDQTGQPRITDFGLAKRTADDSGMTATGQILGTPSYMAPEQATAQIDEIDQSADVYAIGGILYACLTTQPPFRAGNVMETLREVVEKEPAAPSQLDNAIPPDLDTITLKCLQKQKSDRYPSAKEVQRDLDRWLEGRPILARPTSRSEKIWKWCRRNPVISSLLAATLLVGIVAGLSWRSKLIAEQADRETARILVGEMLAASPNDLPGKIAQLQEKKEFALSVIEEVLPEVDADGRASGLIAMGKFGGNELAPLTESLAKADIAYLPIAKDQLSKSRKQAIPLLRLQFEELIADFEKRPAPIRIAHFATLLFQFEEELAALEQAMSLGSATIDSELIFSISHLDTDLAQIVESLGQQVEPDMRRVLTLALGQFAKPSYEIVAGIQQRLSDIDDVGVCAAREWLLQQWGIEVLEQTVSCPGRFENSQGHQMLVVDGPVDFQMGSPETELNRNVGEHLHTRNIPRSFAVSAKEVTVEQFFRYLEDVDKWSFKQFQKMPKQFMQSVDYPIIGITWFQAAGYCNWLSEQEGIAESEWCYVPNKNGLYLPGMRHADNHVEKLGYRLPTEAEWEYCCRAGRNEPRYFGDQEESISRFCWYAENSNKQLHEVGKLMPNRLGFFDMHGNVSERCTDFSASFPETALVADDSFPTQSINTKGIKMRTRGASYIDHPDYIRAAQRLESSVDKRDVFVGFRIAKSVGTGAE